MKGKEGVLINLGAWEWSDLLRCRHRGGHDSGHLVKGTTDSRGFLFVPLKGLPGLREVVYPFHIPWKTSWGRFGLIRFENVSIFVLFN